MTAVLHLVVAELAAGATDEQVDRAVGLGCGMSAAPGATAVLIGRSADALVAVTFLDGRDALEPFAESAPHMAFVMRGLATVSAGIWSASVASETSETSEAGSPTLPAPSGDSVGALWAFGLRDAEGLFEWQVRELLERVRELPGTATVGPTVEDRERYRAAGVVMLQAGEVEAFERALAAARPRWGALASLVDEALAPVASPVVS